MNDFGTNDMFLVVGHDCSGACSVIDDLWNLIIVNVVNVVSVGRFRGVRVAVRLDEEEG